ncbi:hypothetical protein GE09DRAFT_466734 [Coniochaeta sp. 2T2.1]|nr:hypothetical protein GE09DRAFT_466734 [Coniochaeta sp. 2T2.1]
MRNASYLLGGFLFDMHALSLPTLPPSWRDLIIFTSRCWPDTYCFLGIAPKSSTAQTLSCLVYTVFRAAISEPWAIFRVHLSPRFLKGTVRPGLCAFSPSRPSPSLVQPDAWFSYCLVPTTRTRRRTRSFFNSGFCPVDRARQFLFPDSPFQSGTATDEARLCFPWISQLGVEASTGAGKV